MGLVADSSPLSNDSRLVATAQPPWIFPLTWSAGVRAPSKKTSENPVCPDSTRIGLTSTPG